MSYVKGCRSGAEYCDHCAASETVYRPKKQESLSTRKAKKLSSCGESLRIIETGEGKAFAFLGSWNSPDFSSLKSFLKTENDGLASVTQRDSV